MESSEIYFSENSHVDDKTNSAWMENGAFVENENIIWDDNGPEITVDYSETSEQTMTENEGYVTADTDVDETSEYFSILNSNCNNSDAGIDNFNENKYGIVDINSEYIVNVEVEKEEVILPDIPGIENNDVTEKEASQDQLTLYQMEDTNEVYAQQIADDGNGHLQKYLYKVRQTAEGQFEAVLKSVEYIKADPEDIDEQNEFQSNLYGTNIKEEKTWNSFDIVDQKISVTSPTSLMEGDIKNYDIQTSYKSDRDIQKISPNYLLPSTVGNIYSDDYEYNENNADFDINNDGRDYHPVDEVEASDSTNVPANIGDVEHISTLNSVDSRNSESEYEVEELEDFDDEYVKDKKINTNVNKVLNNKLKVKNLELETEDDKALKEVRVNANVKDNALYVPCLVINTTDKENISVSELVDNKPIHFRSILKNNYSTSNVNLQRIKTISDQQPSILVMRDDDENVEDTTMVDGMKETTAIAVKSSRPPRKQIITPVERAGSEIIVQPVIYPVHNPFARIGSTSVSAKRRRTTNEICQVSDESDPEFTLKPIRKRKIKRGRNSSRTHKQTKPIEITISDSDDTNIVNNDTYVIDLLSDHDDLLQNENENKADEDGEARKNDEVLVNNILARSKLNARSNNNSEDIAPNGTKTDSVRRNKIKCPMCPKTFPRQTSLKYHMNIHTARRVLRSKITDKTKTNVSGLSDSVPDEVQTETKNLNKRKPIKFNCEKCKLKFLTEMQYSRHQLVHKKSLLKDDFQTDNKSTFPENNVPKQKNTLLKKNTRQRSSQINRRKIRTKLLESRNSNDKKLFQENLKCDICGLTFYNQVSFNIHSSSHTAFSCQNCKIIFATKFLLDNHLRKNCVKSNFCRQQAAQHKMKLNEDTGDSSTQKRVPSVSTALNRHNTAACNSNLRKRNRPHIHQGVPISTKLQNAFDKLKQKTS